MRAAGTGLIDVAAETKKAQHEIEKLEKLIASKEKKLANENFTSRAPAEVVAKEREGLADLEARLQSAQATLAEVQKLA